MKKLICLFIIVILAANSFVIAEGLLPSIEDAYGIPMPSLFNTLKREPDEQNTLADESVEEIWLDVTNDEYEAFGEYLSQSGCEVINYNVEGGAVVVQIGKDGKSFSLTYDSGEKKAVLVFPKGTYDADLQEIEQLYTKGVDAYRTRNYWTAYEVFSLLSDLDYKDANKMMNDLSLKRWDTMARRISARSNFTVGLKSDGTGMAVGSNDYGQCNVSDWTNIVAISAGGAHTAGLRADGTVVVAGYSGDGRCNTADWTDIIAISAGNGNTVGLKANGTVVAVGSNDYGECNTSEWKDIVAISAGAFHTVGVKSDGTVVAMGLNNDGQCNVSNWTDIVSVSASFHFTLGLKSDGTVVATGVNIYGQCDVSNWRDIVAISTGEYHSVGLKSDGSVITNQQINNNIDGGRYQVERWKDIVAISAGEYNTIGVKKDGTLIVTGKSPYGKSTFNDIDNWKLWNTLDEISNIHLWVDMDNSIGQNRDNTEKDSEINNSDENIQHYSALSIGSKGENVKRLQQALIDQGFLSGKADGDFGKKTEAAVRKAQKAFGLEQTGIADEAFQEMLMKNP